MKDLNILKSPHMEIRIISNKLDLVKKPAGIG